MEKKIIMLAACLMLTLTASADPITRASSEESRAVPSRQRRQPTAGTHH